MRRRTSMRLAEHVEAAHLRLAVALAGMKQVRMRIVVVFPAPFGPRKPMISPGSAENVSASRATIVAVALRQVLDPDRVLPRQRRCPSEPPASTRPRVKPLWRTGPYP
jgi:hypothetical protein